eukprot:1190754-Prorocentrum_minimum.AAC.4
MAANQTSAAGRGSRHRLTSASSALSPPESVPPKTRHPNTTELKRANHRSKPSKLGAFRASKSLLCAGPSALRSVADASLACVRPVAYVVHAGQCIRGSWKTSFRESAVMLGEGLWGAECTLAVVGTRGPAK